jgi:phosphatidylinositol alpha 1,6-mannosyltransferase
VLAADPAARASMGAAGLAGVAGRSWETLVDQLLGHYESVVAARASRAA